MIALDANVLVRLIVEDDAAQVRIARELILREATFVPLTVVMECEWVLRSFYKFDRDRVATALDTLTDVENITFEEVAGVRWALDRLGAGADFADMIHLVQSRLAGAEHFATFDAGLVDEAGARPPLQIETLA